MAKLLNETEIREKLSKLAGWKQEDKKISKTFTAKDFVSVLRFVNTVGEAAEGMDHHPDISIHGYKNATFTLTTHSAGGLTRMDFDLAERIENAFQDSRT